MKNIPLNKYLPNKISVVYDVPYLQSDKAQLLGVKINNEYLFNAEMTGGKSSGYEQEDTYYLTNISSILYDIYDEPSGKVIKYFVINENDCIARTFNTVMSIPGITTKLITINKTKTHESISFDETTKNITLNYVNEIIPGIPYFESILTVILILNIMIFIKYL